MSFLDDLKAAGKSVGDSAIGAATNVANKELAKLTGQSNQGGGVQSSPVPSIPAAIAQAQGMAMELKMGIPMIVWAGVGILALAFLIKKVK